jgi:hypothetical protein
MSQRTPTRLRRRLAAFAALACATALAGPAAAPAQDETGAARNDAPARVAGSAGGDSAEGESGLRKRVVGGLPFTGLDLLAMAAVAVALASMGLAVRRLSAERGARS